MTLACIQKTLHHLSFPLFHSLSSVIQKCPLHPIKLLDKDALQCLVHELLVNVSFRLLEHLFNIKFLGKSSLVIQFCENHFVDSYYPTIENTFTKSIKYRGQGMDCYCHSISRTSPWCFDYRICCGDHGYSRPGRWTRWYETLLHVYRYITLGWIFDSVATSCFQCTRICTSLLDCFSLQPWYDPSYSWQDSGLHWSWQRSLCDCR